VKVFRTKFFQTFIIIAIAYLGIVVIISQSPADESIHSKELPMREFFHGLIAMMLATA